MRSNGWTRRAKLFIQRFWQPTSACMTCMPGSFGNLASALHWELALRTGLVTGVLVLLLSFTRFGDRWFRNRYGNAVVVGCLTMLGDLYAHEDHYGTWHVEAIVTGVVSGLIALAAAWVFEDRAMRLRRAWSWLRERRASSR